MKRLLGLLIALVLGFWAQRTLTGSVPGIPLDALILFIVAGILFVWNARPPKPLREPGATLLSTWRRTGRVWSLAGLLLGIVSLALLSGDLHSLVGLLLWPAATILFFTGTLFEDRVPGPSGQATGAGSQVPSSDLLPAGEGRDSSRTEGFKGPQSRSSLRRWVRRHWDILILLTILAVAVLGRYYQLDVYPNGCQSDECNNGIDALRWLAGAPYQPFSETNEGQATLFTYLVALGFRLFGAGVTQMRAVSALAGVLTVLALYLLARDLYGRKAALVATALLATSRWHITFSRIVYELILQPLFMVLIFLFLIRGLRSGRRRDWALAGIALAAGLNSYTAFRVVPLLLMVFLAFWAVRTALRERWRLRHDLEGMAVLAGGTFTALLPLGVYTVQNWAIFVSRIQRVSVMRDVERIGSIQPIIDNLRKTLYMFNWQGDYAALNNLPGAPMLDTVVAVLFILGLAYGLWYALRGRSLPVLYVSWFVGIASLAVLSTAQEAPSARRTIGMIPLAYLLVALVADQLFAAWRQAWRGLGQRAFAGVVATVVVVVAAVNLRAYFAVQALDPAVWNAYSPSESAIGRFLTTVPRDSVVLVTPQFAHHSAIRFLVPGQPLDWAVPGTPAAEEGVVPAPLSAPMAGQEDTPIPSILPRQSYRSLEPLGDVPYLEETTGDVIYVLDLAEQPLLELLKQIYPTGNTRIHRDRYGQELFLSFSVPAGELAAKRGLVGQFFSSYPPTQAPEAIQALDSLDLDMAESPLPAPFFVVWEGALLAPDYGQYTFDISAEGDAASVQIGTLERLELEAGGSASLSATLAAGFHPLRVEYRSGMAPGRLRLTWSGPGFPQRPLGGRALFPVRLGHQGLVGYYYPNAAWQEPLVLVRNDLMVVPDTALRAPASVLWRGKVAIPGSGTYTFGTRSDDGSFVYIDGQLVVDNGGRHGSQDQQGSIQLEQGFHDIEVRYFDLGGSRDLKLWWQPPDRGRAAIDSRYLFPLEGEGVPEGLLLPPLAEVESHELLPEPDTGVVALPAPELSSATEPDAAAVQPAGELPQLESTVLWTYGTCSADEGQLSSPRGVAVDPVTGQVYVSDPGALRVVKLSEDGEQLDVWGQSGEGQSQLQEPYDLAVEPGGTVVVLDAVNQRLLRFTPDGEFLDSFGAELAFYRPRGLAIDAGGRLYVADTGGLRIVAMDQQGQLLNEAGGRQSELASGQPTDVAATPAGDLYFVEAESGVVTRVDVEGGLLRWGGPLKASTVAGPHLAWRPRGGLAVSDPEGRRILFFGSQGEPVGEIGAEYGWQKPVGLAIGPSTDDGDLVVIADSQACQVVALRVMIP